MLCHFEKYTAYRGSSDADKLHLLALLLRDAAGNWYDGLDENIKTDWTTLREAFNQRFEDTEVLRWRRSQELHQHVQGQTESADDYIAAIRKLTRSVGVGELERYVIQRGLRPELRKSVILAQPTSVDEILTAARLAEAA